MKGLLLKDIYTLLKQFKFFLLILVVFSFVPQMSVYSFAICYSAMLPVTALAYDERSKWDKLAAMFPYSTEDIVVSKYVLGYICVAGSSVLTLLGQTIFALIKNEAVQPDLLVEMLFLACAGVILQAINLPLMLKLGVEKGRMILISTIVIIAIGAAAISSQLTAFLDSIHLSVLLSTVILVAVTAILSLLSIMLSERLHRRR